MQTVATAGGIDLSDLIARAKEVNITQPALFLGQVVCWGQFFAAAQVACATGAAGDANNALAWAGGIAAFTVAFAIKRYKN